MTDTKKSLVTKLHPARYSDMSPKMAAILSGVLGTDWATPVLHHMPITSDGHLMTSRGHFGSAVDLERNVYNLIQVAELTDEELSLFLDLYSAWAIPDYRNPNAEYNPDWVYYAPFQAMLKERV